MFTEHPQIIHGCFTGVFAVRNQVFRSLTQFFVSLTLVHGGSRLVHGSFMDMAWWALELNQLGERKKQWPVDQMLLVHCINVKYVLLRAAHVHWNEQILQGRSQGQKAFLEWCAPSAKISERNTVPRKSGLVFVYQPSRLTTRNADWS